MAGVIETPGGTLALKVTVTVIAEDGKANEAVIKFLAKTWRVPKSNLTLLSGHTDRNKVILISGRPENLMPELISHLPAEFRP